MAEFNGVCRELTISPDGVTLQIVLQGGNPEARRRALDLLGQPGTPVKLHYQQPEHGRYGQQARALYQSGVLVAPPVLRKLGDSRDYVEWVRSQPCCLSKSPVAGYSRVSPPKRWPSDLALLFAVPLSIDAYKTRRDHGDLYCLRQIRPGTKFASEDQALAWFQRAAIESVRRWAWERLRYALDVGSMTQASPSIVRQWFVDGGLQQYLPKVFR